MTKEEAVEFFSVFYGGEHHFPKGGVKEWGDGFCVVHDQGDLATYDWDKLTRLVLMGHDQCVRVAIYPLAFKTLRIAIWSRVRDGGLSQRHPTIEEAIERFRSSR